MCCRKYASPPSCAVFVPNNKDAVIPGSYSVMIDGLDHSTFAFSRMRTIDDIKKYVLCLAALSCLVCIARG